MSLRFAGFSDRGVGVKGIYLAVVLALGGCTSWAPVFKEVAPVVGPAPYVNRTPMNPALHCLRSSARETPELRIGVADFVDGSGASMGDNDVSGRYFSQRPDLMMIVALSKTGVRLVNRTSTAVAEWEMRQAMDRRLGDGKPVVVGQTRFDYRPVRAGEFLGSTFYINGAITEINWALSSNVEEAGFLGATVGRRTYRVSIATDVVVTNSLTTEVVFARSYSKQLVGYESGGGVFRFVDATILPKARVELFQANIGQKQNEPVQQALRWMIELAGYEIISSLTGGDGNCDALVPGLNQDQSGQTEQPVEMIDARSRGATEQPRRSRADTYVHDSPARTPGVRVPPSLNEGRIPRGYQRDEVALRHSVVSLEAADRTLASSDKLQVSKEMNNDSLPKMKSNHERESRGASETHVGFGHDGAARAFNQFGHADFGVSDTQVVFITSTAAVPAVRLAEGQPRSRHSEATTPVSRAGEGERGWVRPLAKPSGPRVRQMRRQQQARP